MNMPFNRKECDFMDDMIYNSPEMIVYKVKILKANGFKNYVISKVLGISEDAVDMILSGICS